LCVYIQNPKNVTPSLLKPSLVLFSTYHHQGLPPVTQTSLSSMPCKYRLWFTWSACTRADARIGVYKKWRQKM